MALIVTVPGVDFTAAGVAPIIVDPMLTDGSLYLVDPMYPGKEWVSGAPSNNQVITNVAADAAAALTGESASNLNITFRHEGGLTGANGLLERSGVGGVHGIVTLANTTGGEQSASTRLPAAITSYMVANPTHDYYFSWWGYVTRLANADQATASLGQIAYSSTVYMAAFGQADVKPTSGARISAVETNPNATGATFRAIGITGATGSPASLVGKPWEVGRFDGYHVGAGAKKSPSHILYRVYGEDLTVSGRSFARVAALDQAEYAKAVTTAGGRYYGDTFTDPATIP